MRIIVNIIFRLPETFAKLVDVSSVQSYSGTSNRRHNKQKGYDFERKPNKEICHRYQFRKGFSLNFMHLMPFGNDNNLTYPKIQIVDI